ncbi:putative potassium channel, partial [Rhizodiscina lignyota]
DWWFASTAVPLIAATIAPLANVLSIAALITFWRVKLYDDRGNKLSELQGIPYPDPRWCYWLNVASLILGFIGNLFLLFNFTNRIRYLIALPLTIICWYIATAILIAITASMNIYVPPNRPRETYSQGFWYAIIAAVLYCICSMILMMNMLGYFLGHYPQHFTLTDHQRTLILQTMLFFIWLAGGAGMFSRIESTFGGPGNGLSFVDGLYFCDVTILTVGFGDIYPHDDVGRGLVFPYSVGGIIMLGLVISSINNFANEISEDKVVKRHIDHIRARTLERTVTTSMELERPASHELPKRQRLIRFFTPNDKQPLPRRPSNTSRRASSTRRESLGPGQYIPGVRKHLTMREAIKSRSKLLVLREEKDRFEAMRRIQHATESFKRWWRLTLSVIAFGTLWCVGAVVFWQAEKDVQGMTYFQGLYFCYVSLLTIGYGDLAPKSNAGRPFFVVWSLIAVPTMTILISDMGDTIISGFKKGTYAVADFTVLPKEGVWRSLLDKFPWLVRWLQNLQEQKRIKRGIPGPEDEENAPPPHANIEELAGEAEEDEAGRPPSDAELARGLADAIRRTAHDLTLETPRKYNYEEWVEFTRLIRFTAGSKKKATEEEEEEGLIGWDWIGEDSPMMSGVGEAEFVLDRLCESMNRYMRR